MNKALKRKLSTTTQSRRSAIPSLGRPNVLAWGLFVVFFLFLGYHSVYFEKLSLRTSKSTGSVDFKTIDAKLYADILQINAPNIDSLKISLSQNQKSAFSRYGNRLGIGNSAYFMGNIEGEIISVDKSEIVVKSKIGTIYHIDLVFIFGNAIRDASKLVKLTDYKKTSDFNALSESLNEIIRKQKIPNEASKLKIGDKINAKVAFKLGKKNPDLSKLTFLPISIVKTEKR